MNAPVLLAARGRALSPMAGEDVVGAMSLGRRAALLLGRHTDRLPRRAPVTAGPVRGACRLTAWAKGAPGAEAWFLAAVQFEAEAPPPGETLVLQGPGQPDRGLALWPGAFSDAEGFRAALAARSEGRAADIALFLADLAAAAPQNAALRTLLRGFIDGAAEDDGAIEIVGSNAGMILLQGWGHAAARHGAEAILLDPEPRRVPLAVAGFDRSDIAAPACGLLEALPANIAAPPIDTLHVVAGGRLRRRRVIAEAMRLGVAETGAHLRNMLPRLSAGEDILADLRRAARPAFAGQDTIAQLPAPIAAAVDLFALLPGAGAYVAGWLLDPGDAIAQVTLCGPGGVALRLDDAWVRLERPDVASAFRADPRFSGMRDNAHGYSAFVPSASIDDTDGWYLSVELRDGALGFLPLRAAAGTPRSLLRRVAATIDLHQPSGHGVVEAALAPLLGAATPLLRPADAACRRTGPAAPTALLLALPEPAGPPAAALSIFLSEPPVPGDESLVIVLGPAWRGGPLAALEAACAFYRLPFSVLLADEQIGLAEAWDIGAGMTVAERFLCLGGPGLQGPLGWRRALAAAVPATSATVVAPTLLYEDGSVRSQGFDQPQPIEAPPWTRQRGRGAGLPYVAEGAAPRTCHAVPLAGAMVSAAAHRAADGFSRGGLTMWGQEAAFFHRLAVAGGRCEVLPGLSLVAPQAAETLAPWHRAARLAEGLALRTVLKGDVE